MDYVKSVAPDRFPQVIKADGLAAGKGVRIVHGREEALATLREQHETGEAGRLVVEEFLQGFEVSFLALSDGSTVRPLACAHDYKRAHDGEQGPMTGGMGAYSPLGIEETLTAAVMRAIVEPAIAGMAVEGTPYSGVLYAGLMLTATGPQVLEFNARFGDPETQVLLPRWQDDLLDVLSAAADGRLAELPALRWSEAATCGVVLASAGYPSAAEVGEPIHGLDQAGAQALVFHGGTMVASGNMDQVVTAGGRVLTVVGQGATLEQARARAYAAAAPITFKGCWCRRDIGSAQEWMA
jgi:phosphoribosylamine--glycine ligase